MENKEITNTATELHDAALENVSGGLLFGSVYVCKTCGKRFTYTGSVEARVGEKCPYCGAEAESLKSPRPR